MHKVDRKNLGRVITENQDTFYRIAKTLLSQDEDCADAISQMIVRSFEKIHTLRNEKYVKTWLTRIIINECYNIMRQNKRISYVDSYDDYDEKLAVHEPESYSELYEAIEKLDEKLRICLVLYHIEGFSIREIAKMLDSTESAVKKRLVRAREGLRRNLEEGEAL